MNGDHAFQVHFRDIPARASVELLTVRDLAQLLKLQPRTVRQWVRSRLLPPPLRLGKHGRILRWRIADLAAYLTEVRRIQGHAEDAESEVGSDAA